MAIAKLIQAFKRGSAAVQKVHRDMVVDAEKRAKAQMARTTDQHKKAIIRANLESEKLKLEREMYEAKARVIREREAVAKSKRAAGVLSWRERAENVYRQLAPTKRTTKRRR